MIDPHGFATSHAAQSLGTDPFVLLAHSGLLPDREADDPYLPAMFDSADEATREVEALAAEVAERGVTHWSAVVCRLSEAATMSRPAPPQVPSIAWDQHIERNYPAPSPVVHHEYAVVVPHPQPLYRDPAAVADGHRYATYLDLIEAADAAEQITNDMRAAGIPDFEVRVVERAIETTTRQWVTVPRTERQPTAREARRPLEVQATPERTAAIVAAISASPRPPSHLRIVGRGSAVVGQPYRQVHTSTRAGVETLMLSVGRMPGHVSVIASDDTVHPEIVLSCPQVQHRSTIDVLQAGELVEGLDTLTYTVGDTTTLVQDKIDITVRVPSHFHVDIHTISADITTHGALASAHLVTDIGTIVIDRVIGVAKAQVRSFGSVRADNIGCLIARTPARGTVAATTVGRTEVITVDGDITVGQIRGEFPVGVPSAPSRLTSIGKGSITCLVSGPTRLDAATARGDIDLSCTATVDPATINARTDTGTVHWTTVHGTIADQGFAAAATSRPRPPTNHEQLPSNVVSLVDYRATSATMPIHGVQP